MELSLVDSAVAEEADHDLVAAAVLDGQREPHGDGQVTAHDGVSPHEALLHVEQVHGSALAAAGARDLAHQLGHHGIRGHAPGQRVAVVAVVGDDIVVLAEVGERPNRDGFLTYVEVEEASDLAVHVQALALLLEPTYEEHLLVQMRSMPLFLRGCHLG